MFAYTTRAFSTVLAFSLLASTAWADTNLLVDTTADDPAAVSCMDAVPDDCSLRGAISTANGLPAMESITIDIPAGDYELTVGGAGGDMNQTGDLDIQRSLTIEGPASGGTSILGGGPAGLDDRLLQIHGAGTSVVIRRVGFEGSVPPANLHAVDVGADASLEIYDCMMTGNGNTGSGGGALSVSEGASALVEDCQLVRNQGQAGAGIVILDGSLTVRTSVFEINQASFRGGAIAVLDNKFGFGQPVRVEGSRFFNNASDQGGAIWGGRATEIDLIDDFFDGNQAINGIFQNGGAIYSRGEIVLDGSTITGGTAVQGVAIAIEDEGDGSSRLEMVNSTISDCSSETSIAAVHLSQTEASLSFSTFALNVIDVDSNMSQVSLEANLFEGFCFNAGGAYLSQGMNLGLNNTCWGGVAAAGDQVEADLRLGPLLTSSGPTPTHRPEATSPAIDHVAGPCIAVDQRRHQRPATGCDSGSVERMPSDAIFIDDFELGNTAAWSVVMP